MSPEPINYETVLADLQTKRDQLDAAIAAIRGIMGSAGALATAAIPRVSDISQIPPRAFVGLSVSVAAHRLLQMVQRRMSTKEIMRGLQAGGLKTSKYRNVYAILRQREADKADVMNVDGVWGLAAWNPERRPRSNLIDSPRQQK
ncbi:MAG TPA: hypothetical protein VGK24_15415 [Candidatus Angelobacter sp.]|jgi:hypothetical protein